MKIFIATLCMSAFVMTHSIAQKDPKALQILDAMSDKYRSTPSFKSEFKYLMENPDENINEGFEGVVFVKDDFYKLLMEGQEVRFDGTYVWTYSKEFEEIQVSPNEEEEEEFTISKIFDLYKTGFKYLYLESRDAGKIDVIDLVPEDLNKSYFKIRMQIVAETKALKSFKIFDKSGSRYVYEIVKFTPDNTLKDSDFTFTEKQMEGKELIDFR
ncbi:MAG: outer membrane lipoprotein carrier protein LolA [Reichenbachiella sp.]